MFLVTLFHFHCRLHFSNALKRILGVSIQRKELEMLARLTAGQRDVRRCRCQADDNFGRRLTENYGPIFSR